MTEPKLGDLVYDSAYKQFGYIIKIWTVEEIRATGRRYEDCAYEVEFLCDKSILGTDRYPYDTICEMKEMVDDELRDRT